MADKSMSHDEYDGHYERFVGEDPKQREERADRITCESIYRRMGTALDKGKGVRLSADELAVLYHMDDAIGTIINNVREGLDARDGTEHD